MKNFLKKPNSLFAHLTPKSNASRPRVLPFIVGAFKRTVMFVGVLALLLILTATFAISRLTLDNGASPLPDEIVLFLDLDNGFVETQNALGLSDPFGDPPLPLYALTRTIEQATDDPRVKGIVARYAGGEYGMAHIQEFRAALADFRKSGKFSYIYSPSYGDYGGFSGYYLASSFDEIWMQPMGMISIPGLKMEMPYIRELLDKVGIKPEFIQFKAYKTAVEFMTRSEMSAQSREMMIDILTQVQTTLLSDISLSREIEEGALIDYVDQGLFDGEEALEKNLIDKLIYSDEAIEATKIAALGHADVDDGIFVAVETYYNAVQDKVALGDNPGWMDQISGRDDVEVAQKSVALIYAAGEIVQEGEGSAGGEISAANDIAPAIFQAIEDPDIEAIILRVNSPGGSAVASETILHALQVAQESGKSVYVSMGTVAASGGYWISTSADRIFALPTTLTGSIGVLGGKISIQELSKKIGVKWDSIEWGDNAGLFSMTTPFSKAERATMTKLMSGVYDGFVERVALGRGLSVRQVENIAQGRVWTGRDALDLGLVDEIGGLHDVLAYAADELGAEAVDDLNVVVLPRPKTNLEKVLELLENAGESYGVMAQLNRVLVHFDSVLSYLNVMTKESGGYAGSVHADPVVNMISDR